MDLVHVDHPNANGAKACAMEPGYRAFVKTPWAFAEIVYGATITYVEAPRLHVSG